MTMLLLKRLNVPLDRDVIFLSEAGEEGNSNFGIQFMVKQHYPEIDAEYCLAEGGGAIRIGGVAKYTTVETLEKIPRGIELVAHGISGHGSIPLKSNAIVHLAGAVAKVGQWRPEIRFNETTGTYFRGLASISPPETAKYYRDVLSTDPKVRAAADEWLFENEPLHSSMLRTSVSPNIFHGGYRSNVIPSEAKATLDVRALPDEDPARSSSRSRRSWTIRPIDVRFTAQNTRPASAVDARLDSEPYKVLEAAARRIYNTITLPTMSTGATDMAQLRAKRRAVLRHRRRRSTWRTGRKATACTAIRSGCSKASCTASSATTTRSCWNWHAPGEVGSGVWRWSSARDRCAGPALTPVAQAPAARLDAPEERDHAALPGGAAVRHQQPARQRASRGRVPQAGARRGRHPAQIFALDPNRPNIVARLKGNGRKRPLLIMGHTDDRHRRRVEMEVPAVQRDARRRLRLRPRHHRRQGQPHRRR